MSSCFVLLMLGCVEEVTKEHKSECLIFRFNVLLNTLA